MATVNHPSYLTRKIFVLVLMLTAGLFFSGTGHVDSLRQRQQVLQKQDDITSYLDYLFDQLDANPRLVISEEPFLETALWRAPRNASEGLAVYHFFTNVAWHLLNQRQVPASIKWYERAYLIYEKYKGDPELRQQMNFEEFIAKPLGNNYTRMGAYSKAIFIQKTAIATAFGQAAQEAVPGLYANLATTYFRMQELDSMQAAIDQGLRRVQANSEGALMLYNLKAESFIESRRVDSAQAWNHKALKISSHLPFGNTAALTAQLSGARIWNLMGAHQNAINGLKQTWPQLNTDQVALKVEWAIEMGNAFLLMHQADSAQTWHLRALSFFNRNAEGLFPDFKVTTALFGIAASRLKKAPLEAADWFEKAVLNDYLTEQLLPVSLNSRTAAYANKQYSEVAIALYHQLYDQYRDPAFLLKALWVTELSKGRMLIKEQRRGVQWQQDSIFNHNRDLMDQLRSLYLLLAETQEPARKQDINTRIQQLEFSLNLKENQLAQLLHPPSYQEFKSWVQRAAKSQSLWSYYLGEAFSYTIHINPKGYHHFLDSSVQQQRQRLKSFTHQYFYQGPQAFSNNPKAYFKISQGLLETWLPGTKPGVETLLMSPDQELHGLPFEALSFRADRADYLGFEKNISYSFSFLQNAFGISIKNQPAAIQLFSFEKTHLGFPALPQASFEKKFLAKKFETHSVPASQITTKECIDALNSGNVVHLATHAVGGDSTGQPYLVFKDKLYLSQLQYITTRSPLVVLAACQTGYGQLKNGEGLQSLGRILVSKGVQGVLSARWEVDDAVSGEMVAGFYSALEQDLLPALALQKARNKYLQNHPALADQNPWYWAAYYFQGNNDAVLLKPNSNAKRIWTILLLMAAITGYLLWQTTKHPKPRFFKKIQKRGNKAST